jgi:hypothetical protein
VVIITNTHDRILGLLDRIIYITIYTPTMKARVRHSHVVIDVGVTLMKKEFFYHSGIKFPVYGTQFWRH